MVIVKIVGVVVFIVGFFLLVGWEDLIGDV